VGKLRWNWPVWLGSLFSLLAFMSYSLVFAGFPATRNVPWVNFLLFGVSATFLFFGLKRMFGGKKSFLGKVISSILIFLSISIFCVFCFVIFHATKQLPQSIGAPKIGQKAPEFALRDTRKNLVSLARGCGVHGVIGPGAAPQDDQRRDSSGNCGRFHGSGESCRD
jgi:hypothetical protein